MTFKLSPLNLALASALSLSLAGCGGGGSGTSPKADTFTLPGTAATGAPYPDGSLVTVTDAAGKTFSGKVADQSGNYEVTVDKAAKAPFVVSVSADDLPTLVSVSTDAQPARINVTPITNLIAATLSTSGNPQKLAEEIRNGAAVTTEKLVAKKKDVMDSILKPVTDLFADSTDPISGTIEIGKGHDLVLEALKIQVQPTGSNTSTVNVTLKSSESLDMAPIALGTGGVSSLPKLAETTGYLAPAKSDLAGEGLPNQISALLGRMTACYALPQSERIKSGGTTASDITADTCKAIFQANDPSKFKHNSYSVSSTGAFKGIFSSSVLSQSVKFSLPSFEYKVKNGNTTDATKAMDGDVIFTARWQDSAGNSGIDEHWARPDANGKLFLTGNLSGMDIEVSPRGEYRELLNLSGKNFYSTGYNIVINAKHPYAKIVATSPKGNPITLVKRSGYDYYVIANKDGSPTTTSVIRLAGAYKDTGTSGTPRTDFAGLIWAGDQDASDQDIAAIGAQGTWRFDLYTNANDSTPAFADIKRRTLQRAPTLAETKASAWPTVVDAVKADARSRSKDTGYITLNDVPSDNKIYIDVDAGDGAAWSVPTGAWSPTKITVLGLDPKTDLSFNDSTNLRSTSRTAVVQCSSTGASDKHCADSQGNYAQNMRIGLFIFSGRDLRRVQMNYAVDLRKQ